MIALALAGSFGISIDNKLSSQLYKNKEIQYLSLDYTLFYTDFHECILSYASTFTKFTDPLDLWHWNR